MGGYSRIGHVRLITAVPDATCLLLQGSERMSLDGLTLPCAGVACSALPLSLGGTERQGANVVSVFYVSDSSATSRAGVW